MDTPWPLFFSVITFGVIVVTLSMTTGRNCQDISDDIPTVNTPEGKYVGMSQNYPGGFQVIKFLGIPFAQPPVGTLRFKRPQPLPKGNPNKTITADTFKKSCISVTKKTISSRYGEDCLYLNVYIPINPNKTQGLQQNDTYSVMIWLHGGGFVAGSAFPEPLKLVMRGNVIVVMVNYRLGVLGFLTTNDEALPGNNGLWDQIMAIRWVKENIRFFGGDENSITVFGESAGSLSAHILTLSPVASGLFHKAIFQSGVANTVFSRDYTQYAEEFGRTVGCEDFSNHTVFADCLRKISASEILQYGMSPSLNLSAARRQIDFLWMPVIDGILIPDNPQNLMNNQTYLHYVGAFERDYLIGVLDNEGGLVVDNFLHPIPLSLLGNETFYSDLIDYLLYIRYGHDYNETSSLIKVINKFYFGTEQLEDSLAPQTVLDVASDALFVSLSVECALAFSACNKIVPPICQDAQPDISNTDPVCSTATAKVFVYLFDYCPNTDPCKVPCMSHGADVAYEFPKLDSNNPEFNHMSDIFIDLLTTFAKTSDPASVLQDGWPAYEQTNQRYLRLSPKPQVRQFMYSYRMKLWLDALPNIGENLKMGGW